MKLGWNTVEMMVGTHINGVVRLERVEKKEIEATQVLHDIAVHE